MPNVNTKCVPESWLLEFHGHGSSNLDTGKSVFYMKMGETIDHNPVYRCYFNM